MDQRNRWRATKATALLSVVLIFPIVSLAAPVPSIAQPSDPQLFLDLARGHESQREWGQALEWYQKVLLIDRNHAEARKRYLVCLRQCNRKYRLDDPSFTAALLNPQLKLSEVMDFYTDVVRKVHELYVHSDKVELTKLFRAGIDELLMDLDDGDFRNRFLKQHISTAEIEAFRQSLRQRSAKAQINNFNEAVEQVRSVVREAVRKLELNGKIVAAEFACGACNALDEYSYYLTQGGLMIGSAEKTGIEAEVLEKGVGYIRIYNFDDSTVQLLETVLHELNMNKVETLVLDLRDNAGGSLEAAVQVVERFVPAPQLIATTSGKLNKTFQSFNMNVADMPMVVLVNGNTASSAELVAGALRTRKDTELVGQTTFGKNRIQKTMPVSQSPFGAIRLSWAQFQVPKSDDIERRGITPTIPIAGAEMQRTTAIDRARNLVPMR